MDPLLVVEDVFQIRGRGIVLAPAIPVEKIRKPATVYLQLMLPDGLVIATCGHIWFERMRLIPTSP
jgi:hypothetical protein